MNRIVVWSLIVISALAAVPAIAGCDSGTNPEALPSPGLPRGQAIFMRSCNTCHPGGGPGSGPSLRNLIPQRDDAALRMVVRKGKKQMPGFNPQVIPDDQLDDLVLYLRSLK